MKSTRYMTLLDKRFILCHADCEPIVTFHTDGRIEVNPKYTTEEAARVFWEWVCKQAGFPQEGTATK